MKLFQFFAFFSLKILLIFLKYFLNFFKKAGNARRRLLAYPSFSYIETMQNGKVDFE